MNMFFTVMEAEHCTHLLDIKEMFNCIGYELRLIFSRYSCRYIMCIEESFNILNTHSTVHGYYKKVKILTHKTEVQPYGAYSVNAKRKKISHKTLNR